MLELPPLCHAQSSRNPAHRSVAGRSGRCRPGAIDNQNQPGVPRADGRCAASAIGQDFQSRLTYARKVIQPGDPFRCAVPPVPPGHPLELVVTLAAGARPSGRGSPPLQWTEKEGRWVGTASLRTPPELVTVDDWNGRRATIDRWLLRGAVASLILALVAIAFRRFRAARRRTFPERPPQHFADHRLWQLAAELDSRRHFVRRELLAAVGAQVRFAHRLAGTADHPRPDDFALRDVDDAGDTHLGHRRVARERLFDFARPHLETAGLDQVLFPSTMKR